MEDRTTWVIWINNYGQFDFDGTEAEAEDRRAAKARHEGAQGRTYRKDLARESDRVMKEICDLWDAGEGAPEELFQRLKRARTKERSVAA